MIILVYVYAFEDDLTLLVEQYSSANIWAEENGQSYRLMQLVCEKNLKRYAKDMKFNQDWHRANPV